jgi:hypothetical protein
MSIDINGVISVIKDWQTLLAGLIAIVAGSFALFAAKAQIAESRRVMRNLERAQHAKALDDFLRVFRSLELLEVQYEEYEQLLFKSEEKTQEIYVGMSLYLGEAFTVLWDYLGTCFRLLDNQIYHSGSHPKETFLELCSDAAEHHANAVQLLRAARLVHPDELMKLPRYKKLIQDIRAWSDKALKKQSGGNRSTSMTHED